jgi:hypothetical protein
MSHISHVKNVIAAMEAERAELAAKIAALDYALAKLLVSSQGVKPRAVRKQKTTDGAAAS